VAMKKAYKNVEAFVEYPPPLAWTLCVDTGLSLGSPSSARRMRFSSCWCSQSGIARNMSSPRSSATCPQSKSTWLA
jgi:hypothetical protein